MRIKGLTMKHLRFLREIERIFPHYNTQFQALENAYIIKFQVSRGVIFIKLQY